jgi:Fe-S-cluster containining protein
MIAAKLGVTREEFIDKYTDRRWPGINDFLIRQDGFGCIFLKQSASNKQKLCQIHIFKPQCCLDWQFGKQRQECQEGLRNIWGLTLDSNGNLCGPREKLREFKQYLKMLNNPL